MAKIYEQLPLVNQTIAVKNFFESTVEQLFSEVSTETISGFIGHKTSSDHNVDVSFIAEPSINRTFYSLSPAVNTINLNTGVSEDFVFFDEYINTLKTYGANTINQDKIFSTDFQTFLPPINVDKLINYQEYYFDPKTVANCHDIYTWAANTSYKINDVILHSGNYYIANRNFTTGSSFLNDASIDDYNYVPDITQSTNAVITTNQDHNFYTGDKVVITDVQGMTEVNNQTYYVEKITSRTLKLYTDKDIRVPLDSSSFNTWTSGGTITHNSGPTPISISGNVSNYIDVEKDITNKKYYTTPQNKIFRNGMVVKFTGDYVVSSSIVNDREYIVEGVGDAIILVDKTISTASPYSFTTGKDYIVLGRGSSNKNIWSRTNFWWKKENYLDAEDRIPNSGKRSLRPILEYDADLELYNHGINYKASVDLSIDTLTFEQANNLSTSQMIDGIDVSDVSKTFTCIFPNESELISKNIYTINASGSTLLFSSTQTLEKNDIVIITQGQNNKGLEYFIGISGFELAQSKPNRSTPPLFTLYRDDKSYLGDNTLYPLNNFSGNKIFGHKLGSGANDSEYGFPLSFKSFKSSGEIEYENFLTNSSYNFTAVGSTTPTTINGYYYYKLLKPETEYHKLYKNSNKRHKQRINTHYQITSLEVDQEQLVYFCGAEPIADTNMQSGYDIRVKVNNVANNDFTYFGNSYIKFNNFTFTKGDLIDVSVRSNKGLFSENSISKYELPLSWSRNPLNEEIATISEPEFLQHFTNYMESQVGFSGNVLASNNFTNTTKETRFATDIVKTTQDTLLGAFLLDDKPYNLIDAIRFNKKEFSKYKKRFLNELTTYFNTSDISDQTNDFILEKVLRSVISFSVGRKVFNQTYIIPFGDNYFDETHTISDTSIAEHTITHYADLSKLENSLLIYKDRGTSRTLLRIGEDYNISSYNPITIQLLNISDFNTGDILTFRFYDADRDSGQCPPTPSAMGLYPLYQPSKVTDSSFQTPQTLIIGHDGSRTPLFGDRRDDIVLEFENRIYNSAKKEFRDANSLGFYSSVNIRPGYFRNTDFEITDWSDLLNMSFQDWANENNVDPIVNDFYDQANEFTWNYRGNTDIPGYWKGWYEYYYDTVRPNTHPWEMLGFTEKPTWWDTRYITAVYTDYSSSNTPMWQDIEQGIIRQGPRENFSNGIYKLSEFNPYRRIGLLDILPVDANAKLISPYDIANTGATTITPTYTNSEPDTSQGYFTTSFLKLDGINVNYSSSNVFVKSNNIINHNVTISDSSIEYTPSKNQELTYTIPKVNLASITTVANQAQNSDAIALAINGLPIYNIQDSNTWNNSNYHYNKVESEVSVFALGNTTTNGVQYYYTLTKDVVGETAWGNSTTHSGIVGWAFDGLPIYGPYGYANLAVNGDITDSNISIIKSCFELKSGNRDSVMGGKGAHTGEFTEDYEFKGTNQGQTGYVGNDGNGKFNMRYGKTPESPNTAIKYYVLTHDDNLKPMFPYHVGGGEQNFNGATLTYANRYFATPITENNLNAGTFDTTATNAIISAYSEAQTTSNDINNQWRIGDGAPVENAWKYSTDYPFAVAEALLIAKPGLFATMFSDPVKIKTATIDRRNYISTETNKKWLFTDKTDFKVHGETDSDGLKISNIGYTQFIDSWLKFQGLEIETEFAEKLRTLNIKLGHRFAGFVDKDTMRLSLDQYSATGSSTNLILPNENITIDVHDSGYKSRNFYSGVIIEKTVNGWKVRGFDKQKGYFETLQLDFNGATENVNVGGDPVSHSVWAANVSYNINSYVEYQDVYYRAISDVPSSETFNILFWQSLSALPQENSASAVYYQSSTDVVEKVYYDTEYTDIQSLFNFLIGLGRFQERAGFYLEQYDSEIADVRGWLFAAKQYLFWTTGSWQVGNTIELSPISNRVAFTPPNTGFVSRILRSERDMFSIVDQNGRAIEPTECAILRENTSIEIVPPAGQDIYGIVLYAKELEHAMVIDNVTDFADTLFDPKINQRQNRIKIKATRTSAWDGRFVTNGFIIDGDELIPNLDTLAGTMTRYNEVGFIPVQRDVYDVSRRQYGYQERSYLNELDITDDQQFNFYKGMIQSKGTANSLSRIARSNKIVQGEMNVYDEWAIKVGDFGDVNNDQSIELKIDRANVLQDPQLITLAFPQDTTGVVTKIDVVNRKHKYFSLPTITINNPLTGSNVATAEATLFANGEINNITVTNAGSGYTSGANLVIETATISTFNTDTSLTKTDALSSNYVTLKEYDGANANLLVNSDVANITGLGNLTLTDHFGVSNANAQLNTATSTYDLSSITDLANVATLINNDATMNANITASVITISGVSNISSSSANVGYFTYLQISGNDFSLSDDDGNVTLGKLQLADSSNRYQPKQRHKVSIANNTSKSNVVVSVSNVTVDSSNYDFDAGGRWKITPSIETSGSGASVTFNLAGGTGYNVTQITPDDLGNVKTSFDIINYTTKDNNDYSFVDVYLDDRYIENEGDITYYTLTNNSITFANVELLPGAKINKNANVYVIEHATIDFVDSFQGDLPGATLNVKAFTNDDITVHLGTRRNYEITPDANDDEVILLDIDDKTKFLKKPTGLRSDELWATTSNVSSIGITDSKFNPLPNSGYVNPDNVTYQAFSIPSISSLFAENIIYKPEANDTIHVAKAENSDWNVYKLTDTNATLSFVEQDDFTETAYLYLNDVDLFNYVDNNAIGGIDNNRYLDYHLIIKDANLSDQFVVWTNQEIVSKKGVTISDFAGANMITANIVNIGPYDVANTVLTINNISGSPTQSTVATANTTSTPGVIQISTSMYNLENNDIVSFSETQPSQVTFNVTSVEPVRVTVSANVSTSSNVVSYSSNASLTFEKLSYDGNSIIIPLPDIDANQYSNVTAGSFNIGTEYIILEIGNTDWNTAAGTTGVTYVVGDTFTSSTAGSGTGVAAPTSGIEYITDTDLTIPNSYLSSSNTLVTVSFVDTELLKLNVANIHQSGANIVKAGRTIDIVSSNSSINQDNFTIEEVGEHYIVVRSEDFLLADSPDSANVEVIDIANMSVTGFQYNNHSNIHNNTYSITNVSSRGFTIADANITANISPEILSMSYLGKAKISVSNNDHNLASGDIVKLVANTYSGYYYVESATANTFVIDAPYNTNVPKSGSVIKAGLQIETDVAHGIDSTYEGKRIAVHMAEPKYYNRVYVVDSITSNTTIKISDAYSYGVTADSQFTPWGAGNSIVKDERIKNINVMYLATSSFTAGSTFDASNLLITKPAVLTTIDHNRIKLNNSDIVLNDISSEDAVVQSLNTAMALRRGAIDTDHGQISFPMLTGNFDQKLKPILGDYRQIAGSTPYVTAEDIDNTPLTDGLSRAGTMNIRTFNKGFENNDLNPLLAQPQSQLSTLNTDPSNPAYLGKNNNYSNNASKMDIPLFNVPDSNFTPMPNTGFDSGAKPIIDPRKALADTLKKPCVEVCAPIKPVSSPVVPILPPQRTTIDYSGTLLHPDTGNPGIKIISANSKGARKWTSEWAGYFYKTGSGYGSNNQVGGTRGGLSAKGLAGLLIWSDNGSTQTFNISIKFSKAGTFYLHALRAGRAGYEDRNYVTFSTASNGSLRHNAKFVSKTSLDGTNAKEFTVAENEVVTFRGTARAGKNHWNGFAIWLSTSPNGFETSVSKLITPKSGSSTGYGNIPQQNYSATNTIVSYHEQHARTANGTDEDFFVLTNSGQIQILFDFYSGADRLDVYQGVSKGGENLKLGSTDDTLIKLTDVEKNEILNKVGGQTNSSTQSGRAGGSTTQNSTYHSSYKPTIRDFDRSGQYVKNGGKLLLDVDIANGTYLKIVIRKPSSVYRYVLKLPNQPQKKIDPPKDQKCASSRTQTPIYQPHGQPVTQKKKPGTGNSGGGSGGGGSIYSGGGSGGGSASRKNNYSAGSVRYQGSVYNYMQNYGGFGLAPMAGFSMIPDIFKKTVKVTSSNTYGKYQPLTTGQYVNNTVQRVTGNQILPLARPLRNVAPSRPGPLRALDLSNYPFWNELKYTGDNYYIKGNNIFTYEPGKIGSDIRLKDGTLIGNVLDDLNVSDSFAGESISFIYPGQLPNILPNPDNEAMPLLPNDAVVPPEDAPVDPDIDYNKAPIIEITPKLKNELGNYLPAGPTIQCELSRPTPGHVIALDEMTGVKPGDEIIINKIPIRFPGSDPKVIENALRCTQGGGFKVMDTFKNGKPALRISSCTNAPLTIRDGCAGGVYKEVLDFHVVRGFEQLSVSNTVVVPATTGYTGTSGNTYVDIGTNLESTYTMYNAEGVVTDYTGSDRTVQNSTTQSGSILSSKSYSMGGSGYQIGDRLRLVGGLPIENPYGGITELCIDNPGLGYSSPVNVKVYIGDGTTPGSGARAGRVTLNSDGGITSVEILSGGEGYDFSNPPKVRIVDIGAYAGFTAINASITPKVGTGKGMPPRVAKFIVSAVDNNGAILGIQIIDRGIYKQFPSDLTMGVPLEYDAVGLGDETGIDPTTGKYYQGTGLGQFSPLNDNEVLPPPGAYNPLTSDFGGGTGARVFLTAREIPDCSERGDARSQLGLPETVVDINIPEDLSACLNTALADAGYDPNKVNFDTEPLNPYIDLLKLRTPGYDGVEIGEGTPGFLDKLGIPAGDYNIDSLCIDANIITADNPNPRPDGKVQVGTNLLDDNRYPIQTTTVSPKITINCIDTIGPGYDGTGARLTNNQLPGNGNGQDANSILGGANVAFTTDMFQYELRTPDGRAVNTENFQQECKVLYLESARYNTEAGLDLANVSNVWIDNYSNSGWAYFESSNIPSITQPKLVDTTFVKNAILYDQETGEKEYDLHFYDPFKGIIPGFIQKEIHFTGESDPVVYNNTRTGFGRKDIGKVWWNTSTISYQWYEQGSNRERWLNWGKTFPGSGVTLYEWVESLVPPSQWGSDGQPKNGSEFVLERRYDTTTRTFRNFYYYWVQNRTVLEETPRRNLGREYDTFTLAKYIADPVGSGLPLISFVSDKSVVLTNIAPLLREDEQNLQINFSRNLNPVGQKHTAWKLLREHDNNSYIPEDLSDKLIDSLAGVDALGQSVPDPLLSEVEACGIQFRPRQSMFKDLKGARQVLHYTLNEILADLKLNTNYPNWDSTLPTVRTYIESVNWYETQYVDASTNKKVRYDNTFKPIYKVNSVNELATLQNIPDNTIVQVKSPNSTEYSLHKYIASSQTFEMISITNDNVKLKETVYTDNTNPTLSSEIRLLLKALKDNVFADTNLWNRLFFALLKFAHSEQKQLSWAFKSSYIYIEKEEEDLIEVNGFKVDNFDKVLQYFDEVKPYTSKIREYKDGKSPVKETIGTNSVSDFDKPPYADPVTGNVRILDDFIQADSNIIQTNNAYTKYYSISNKSLDPIRHSNTTIRFDRVDYNLLPHDYRPAVNVSEWQANTSYPRSSYVVHNDIYYKANADVSESNTFVSSAWVSLGQKYISPVASEANIYYLPIPQADTMNSAIARNIVTLTLQSNSQIQANTLINASERAFKFNPAIQTQFTAELNDYYSITDAVSNANVINSSNISSSIANITAVVNAGGLNKTLTLVKTATGGDFQGDIIDANLFSQQFGVDSNTYNENIGFNRLGWNAYGLDTKIDITNYDGVFNTSISGNEVTFEKDGVLYDGFDGVTFKRVLYGEERPQELSLIEPLENLIIRVTTHAYQDGDANSNVVSSNATTVKYLMTNNIYGDSEFIRIKQDGTTTTTLTANLYTYSDEISVANASVLAKPLSRIPGVIWVGSERIEYTKRNLATNTLGEITRGTNGTSNQDWTTGTQVINGNSTESFEAYPVTANVWLDSGAVSLADLGNANISSSTSIMRFLHGRE